MTKARHGRGDRDLVWSVQRAYPQVYLACHTRHTRARSSEARLSARDGSVLAHLDVVRGLTPGDLAEHLGVAPATVSACLDDLEELGYIERRRDAKDRRRHLIHLSASGARAMQASSVLEEARVRRVLARLDADERQRAVSGLELLARASREEMLASSKKNKKVKAS